jgi:hypothetical protein
MPRLECLIRVSIIVMTVAAQQEPLRDIHASIVVLDDDAVNILFVLHYRPA